MINYDDLKTKPKEFLAVTGLTHEEFVHLLPTFEQIYRAQTGQQTNEGKPRRRQPGAGTKGKPGQIQNKLLFILAYQKGYELQTFLALHFGISQPQANYWIHRLLPLLQHALAQREYTPERDASAVADYLGPNDTPPDLIIDGTERRRQRPQDPTQQKEDYSGKKKPIRTRT
jgi:Helix-turn-helix of DDE superfamily endonuclease